MKGLADRSNHSRRAYKNRMNWQQDLDAAIDARAQQIVSIRRHLHAHPEISGEERDTTMFLQQLLVDEGFRVRLGPDDRGLIVDAPSESDRPKIAVRADIDALRLQDQKDVPYRSCRDGVMHACGHDAHSSILFGTLCSLRDLQRDKKLPWEINFRGIFQPAEETAEGALEMVEAGALDQVRAILATHVDPSRLAGRIGTRVGAFTANCDNLQITIMGRGGHAARPHEAVDPIATAAILINSIYLSVPRATDSQDAVVITIGQIAGGENPNVIPDRVELRGTMRTLDFAVRDRTKDHLRKICRGIEASTGSEIHLTFYGSIPSVRNDPQLTMMLNRIGGEVLGAENVDDVQRASMGSEDFAAYLDHIPGSMFRLGSAAAGAALTPLHTPRFDIDESALTLGAKILARAVVTWSDPENLGTLI